MLAAAARLFATRGYAATTMNDVAAACGVSKATLYHYVHDKHDLLAQVWRGHVARLEALLAQVLARRLAPHERLAALIEAFMAAYAGAENEHRVLTEDVKFLRRGRSAKCSKGSGAWSAFTEAIAAARQVAAQPMAGALASAAFRHDELDLHVAARRGPLSHESVAQMVSSCSAACLRCRRCGAERHCRRSAEGLPLLHSAAARCARGS
ncbi:MAG: helix-turn-helix domain-containing protein [Rubrivivax sp.]